MSTRIVKDTACKQGWAHIWPLVLPLGPELSLTQHTLGWPHVQGPGAMLHAGPTPASLGPVLHVVPAPPGPEHVLRAGPAWARPGLCYTQCFPLSSPGGIHAARGTCAALLLD